MKGYRYSRSYNKYPDGYYPKIEYWTKVLQGMVENKDTHGILWATEKIKYFTGRQQEKECQEELKADSQISMSKDEGVWE